MTILLNGSLSWPEAFVAAVYLGYVDYHHIQGVTCLIRKAGLSDCHKRAS